MLMILTRRERGVDDAGTILLWVVGFGGVGSTLNV